MPDGTESRFHLCNATNNLSSMNASLSIHRANRFRDPTPSEFHVVVLYGDGVTGLRGKHTSDRLLRDSGGDRGCSRQLWSFDVLSIPDVATAALDAARDADLLILALTGECVFPGHVHDGLKRWTWAIADRTPSLAALFQQVSHRTAYRIHLFLQMLAAEKHLVYFPHCDFKAAARYDRSLEDCEVTPGMLVGERSVREGTL